MPDSGSGGGGRFFSVVDDGPENFQELTAEDGLAELVLDVERGAAFVIGGTIGGEQENGGDF